MRTRLSHLVLAPVLLLATACAENPTIPAPGDATLATNEADAVSYEVIALGGGNGWAWAMNDAGVAVGMAGEGGTDPALRWVVTSDGFTGPEDLGSLPPPFADASGYHPNAVNASGLVVGFFNHQNRDGAFVFGDASGMQVLPRFVGSTIRYYAHDVSDVGIIVGLIEYSVRDEDGTLIDRPTRAAVWANWDDEPILLPPLAGHNWGSAYAINTAGLVAGSSRLDDGPGRSVGVAWRIGEAGELVEGPYELEAGFVPYVLNNGGDMAGLYPEFCRAGFLRAGAMTGLSPLAAGACTHVFGISDAAADGTVRIVGSSGDRAALWAIDAGGQAAGPVDLGSERGNRGGHARGVNVHGWVVGAGRTPQGDIPLLWLPKQAGDEDERDPAACTHPRGKCR
jgi:hypothetical protein